MTKQSFFDGWGYVDTIKLILSGNKDNLNDFFKELKKNFPDDEIEKVNEKTIEAFVDERQVPIVKKIANVFKFKATYKEGGKTEEVFIAKVILDQLGGQGKLVVMTGAFNFIALKNGVAFKLKSRKANFVKITLNSKDLYDIEFLKLIGIKPKKISEYNDIYFDQLIPIFEKETGMFLNLFKKGGLVSTQNRDMVLSQLKAIHHHEKELKTALKSSSEIEAWILAKVQRATVDLSDVTHYLDGKTEYANGGVTDNLLRELNRLQKDLNSSRLSTYLQGDTSKEEEARQRERQSKVNRFYEVLKLLNDSDKKFSNGGGLSVADANPYIAGAKAVQGIAPHSVAALDQRLARKFNPDPNRPVFFATGGEIYTHKHSRNWGETIKIELLEQTKNGWKVRQTTTKGRSIKSKIAYFSISEVAEQFEKM